MQGAHYDSEPVAIFDKCSAPYTACCCAGGWDAFCMAMVAVRMPANAMIDRSGTSMLFASFIRQPPAPLNLICERHGNGEPARIKGRVR
jgi:hypothetical protein